MNEPVPGVVSLSAEQAPGVIAASIRASVAAALKDVPGDAKGALVGIATEKGVNLVFAMKYEHGWRSEAWIGKDWTGPIRGGVVVQKIWR